MVMTAIYKNISPKEAREIIAIKGNLLIIDIRYENEFTEGHIAGALHLNKFSDTFEADLVKLDRTKPYLVYCARGNRSKSVFALMQALDFAEVYHLIDGYDGLIL